MDAQSLIQDLNPILLTAEASALVLWEMGVTDDPEKIVQFMYQGGPVPPQMSAKRTPPTGPDPRPDRKYWEYVKSEIRTFLCADDKKYKPLWKELESLGKQSTTVVVGVVATFLSQSLGVAATLLTGFVAVCLYTALKLGKEAYCKYTAPSVA